MPHALRRQPASAVKRAVRAFLLAPGVNRVLLGVVRVLPISSKQRFRFPVRGPARCTLPNGKTLLLATEGSDGNSLRIWWEGLASYEPESLSLWWALLDGSDVVLDVGANAGLYSLVAALRAPSARVLAFEPLPVAAEHVRANAELNGVTNIDVIEAAVASEPGHIELFVLGQYMHQVASTLPRMAAARQMQTALTVPAVTIDAVVTQRSLATVDLIKIDTEGTEYEILCGARQTLEQHRPVVLYELLHGFVNEGLVDLISSVDYVAFWVSSSGLVKQQDLTPDAGNSERNYVLVPSESVDSVVARVDRARQQPWPSPSGTRSS